MLDEHRALGARLTEFAGWDMPLQYVGVVSEHNAVRTGVGVFDVSHLGKLLVSGPDAEAAVDAAVTADIAALEVGRASYALALNDDGGCIDDVFIYRLAPDELLVVPNAANVAAVATSIESCGGSPTDEWARWAILAVQGPDSFDTFMRAFPTSGADELAFHQIAPLDVFGSEGMVARTGYTGERGFELYAPADTAVQAWRALLANGATPVGLGARDTLRLEMGYALYGHELAPDIDPIEASVGWAVAWDSGFRGRDALAKIKEAGAIRKLVGLRCVDRGVPRQGYEVAVDGRTIGSVTSGNHSPTLNTGIALALCERDAVPAVAGHAGIVARGRTIDAVIVKPPFIGKDR
ncbi:MAG: aminomethyltransferase [Actinomycetota bacterium]|nr:aminomethyltransferase [Actinomycetota bacterium]